MEYSKSRDTLRFGGISVYRIEGLVKASANIDSVIEFDEVLATDRFYKYTKFGDDYMLSVAESRELVSSYLLRVKGIEAPDYECLYKMMVILSASQNTWVASREIDSLTNRLKLVELSLRVPEMVVKERLMMAALKYSKRNKT